MNPNPDFGPVIADKPLLGESHSGAPVPTLLPGSAGDSALALLMSRLAVPANTIIADPQRSAMLDEHREGNLLERHA
jgi:hypothetical protein